MEGEYLSDLSSSYEEEKSLKKKNTNQCNDRIANSDNNNNNDNDDDDSDSGIINSNMNDSSRMNSNNYYENIFLDPRIREQQELEEAIRLSLLEQERNSYKIPKYEDSLINRNSRNNFPNRNHPLLSNRSNSLQRHHRHRHKSHRNPGNDGQAGSNEVSIDQIIIQSKKEEEDTKVIREFVSNREKLHEVLEELPGVDSNDPCFEQFLE